MTTTDADGGDHERDERIARPTDRDRRGEVVEVDETTGDPDASDVDDDQDTDHLARLDDPDVLARVEQLDAQRWADR